MTTNDYPQMHKDACRFGAVLLEQRADLIRKGAYHPVIDELLTVAKQQKISVYEAYRLQLGKANESKKKADNDWKEALAAYDACMTRNNAEIKRVKQLRDFSQSNAVSIENQIKSRSVTIAQHHAELTRQGYNPKEITAIQQRTFAPVEQLQKELTQAKKEESEASQHLAALYDEANNSKAAILYGRMREGVQ